MIAVATDEEGVDRIRERLTALGASSVEIVAPSASRRVLMVELIDDWDSEPVATSLRSDGVLATSRPRSGPAMERWLETVRPTTIGGRLTIAPAWSPHDRDGLPGFIELGPGGFGNGHHPTTRLVVEELVDRIRGGERVLDVGCGSGVLALCALDLGAMGAVGVDLMHDAVDSMARNAAINGMGCRAEAIRTPLTEIDAVFDVVVANIARAGIVELADQLVAKVAPGGWIALSGISASQCDQVAEFLRPLTEIGRRTDGDWAVLVLGCP